MKDKTEVSKELLEKAFHLLPSGHDMTSARQYIQRALNEINHAAERRAKKLKPQPTIENKWIFDLKKGLVNPMDAKKTIKTIDQMIEDEQNKIDGMKKSQEGGGNEDMGTILG